MHRYLSCGGNASTIDFYALNTYRWCGAGATIQSSKYSELLEKFSYLDIPLFFSEYGCNKVRPRTFTEVAAVLGDEMTKSFSGGLIYEWTQEKNDYGIVDIQSNGDVKFVYNEFETLQKVFAANSGPSTFPSQTINNKQECPADKSYDQIVGPLILPNTEGSKFLANGVDPSAYSAGKLIASPSPTSVAVKVETSDGKVYKQGLTVDISGYKPGTVDRTARFSAESQKKYTDPSTSVNATIGSDETEKDTSNSKSAGVKTVMAHSVSVLIPVAGIVSTALLLC